MTKLDDATQMLLDTMIDRLGASEKKADVYQFAVSALESEAKRAIRNAENCALDGLINNLEQYFLEKTAIEEEASNWYKRNQKKKDAGANFTATRSAWQDFHNEFEKEFNSALYSGCKIKPKSGEGHFIGEKVTP